MIITIITVTICTIAWLAILGLLGWKLLERLERKRELDELKKEWYEGERLLLEPAMKETELNIQWLAQALEREEADDT